MAADLTLDDMGFPTDNPSSAPAMIWKERKPHSAARSHMDGSSVRKRRKSPDFIASVTASSNTGPSGAYP